MSPDRSLHTALSHLVDHLTNPLASKLEPAQLNLLRTHVRSILTLLFAPSWHADDPSRGSAFRSLIGRPGLLPRPLRQAAAKANVDLDLWERCLVEACDGETEWQSWCDPGRVQWRNGGWEWEDGVWFFGGWRDLTTTLWATSSGSGGAPTPRVSHAVTIRSPIPATPNSNAATPMPVSHLLPSRSVTPPTPTRSTSPPRTHAPLTSANLLALPLPPFADRPDSPSAESDISSSTFTSASATSTLSQTSSSHPAIHADGCALLSAAGVPSSVGGHKRISSIGSNSSTSSSLAPPSRSASPSCLSLDAHGRKKPVTAYDGGKVGVLGGGVKLGGGPAASMASGPTSPRKPRMHAGSTNAQHPRSRSAHRAHHGGGPFGQPMFGAHPGAHPPMPNQAAYAGVFNVGF